MGELFYEVTFAHVDAVLFEGVAIGDIGWESLSSLIVLALGSLDDSTGFDDWFFFMLSFFLLIVALRDGLVCCKSEVLATLRVNASETSR